MQERQPNPRALRLQPLCKAGDSLQGSWPLVGMQRLSDGFAAVADGAVQWALLGSARPVAGGESELWVQLRAHAVVPLQCQRCLGPLAELLEVERSIRFVRGEDLAARLDEEADDDVLSLPPALDLHALVEDELILALPLVPRHEGPCPEPLLSAQSANENASAQPADKEPHPFAALASLKSGSGSA